VLPDLSLGSRAVPSGCDTGVLDEEVSSRRELSEIFDVSRVGREDELRTARRFVEPVGERLDRVLDGVCVDGPTTGLKRERRVDGFERDVLDSAFGIAHPLPVLDVLAVDRLDRIKQILSARGAIDRQVFSPKRPGRDHEVEEIGVVIQMLVCEKQVLDSVQRFVVLDEAVDGARPTINQRLFPIALNVNRGPCTVGERDGTPRPEYRDFHGSLCQAFLFKLSVPDVDRVQRLSTRPRRE
jgi:hypothetical protein